MLLFTQVTDVSVLDFLQLQPSLPSFAVGVLATVMLFRAFGWRLYADLRRAHGVELSHYKEVVNAQKTEHEEARARWATDRQEFQTQVTQLGSQVVAMLDELAKCRAESHDAKLEADRVRRFLAEHEERLNFEYRKKLPLGE